MKTVLTDHDTDVVEIREKNSLRRSNPISSWMKGQFGLYVTSCTHILRTVYGNTIAGRSANHPNLTARRNKKATQEQGSVSPADKPGLYDNSSGLANPLPPSLPLKVGFLSYPMLFQNKGGLQVQVRETQASLRRLGFNVRLIDTTQDDLADFDIVHIFSVLHGNVKLVEQARAKGCQVVVSGLLNPALVVKEPLRLATVRILEALIARVSRYKVRTDFSSIRKALANADHIIALSNWERRVASQLFGADAKRISVVSNGVSEHFFKADSVAFNAEYTIAGPFVFCPGIISPWKNQISLVKALVGTDITVVLAGPVHEQHPTALDDCLGVPGAKVVYLGNLDRESPVLSGAYAAASAVVLPSTAESGPLVALEALAAGTPAIITCNNGLDMQPDGRCLHTVPPFDVQVIRKTVLAVVAAHIDPEICRAAVEKMSWGQVAHQIGDIYLNCVSHAARSNQLVANA
ncbi:glycosyltransferase family 4 protein [Massilia brevitalea]|uniref:glycosyltransferase family 4 protein n=1 Tax=Massilia brevitalea TaxID=442526 RepID=UPI002739B6E4|nr:glycosyltransferase family 4 protein [Massilia brevitalea]